MSQIFTETMECLSDKHGCSLSESAHQPLTSSILKFDVFTQKIDRVQSAYISFESESTESEIFNQLSKHFKSDLSDYLVFKDCHVHRGGVLLELSRTESVRIDSKIMDEIIGSESWCSEILNRENAIRKYLDCPSISRSLVASKKISRAILSISKNKIDRYDPYFTQNSTANTKSRSFRSACQKQRDLTALNLDSISSSRNSKKLSKYTPRPKRHHNYKYANLTDHSIQREEEKNEYDDIENNDNHGANADGGDYDDSNYDKSIDIEYSGDSLYKKNKLNHPIESNKLNVTNRKMKSSLLELQVMVNESSNDIVITKLGNSLLSSSDHQNSNHQSNDILESSSNKDSEAICKSNLITLDIQNRITNALTKYYTNNMLHPYESIVIDQNCNIHNYTHNVNNDVSHDVRNSTEDEVPIAELGELNSQEYELHSYETKSNNMNPMNNNNLSTYNKTMQVENSVIQAVIPLSPQNHNPEEIESIQNRNLDSINQINNHLNTLTCIKYEYPTTQEINKSCVNSSNAKFVITKSKQKNHLTPLSNKKNHHPQVLHHSQALEYSRFSDTVLTKQIEDMQETIKVLEAEVTRLSKQPKEKANDDHSARLESLREITQKYAELKYTEEDMENELFVQKNRLKSLYHTELKEKLQEFERNLQSKDIEIDNLGRDYETRLNEVKQIHMGEILLINEENKRELDRLKKQFDEELECIRKREKETIMKSMQKEIDLLDRKYREQINSLNARIQVLQERDAENTRYIDLSQAEIHSKEAVINSCRQSIEKEKQISNKLKSELENLRKEKNELLLERASNWAPKTQTGKSQSLASEKTESDKLPGTDIHVLDEESKRKAIKHLEHIKDNLVRFIIQQYHEIYQGNNTPMEGLFQLLSILFDCDWFKRKPLLEQVKECKLKAFPDKWVSFGFHPLREHYNELLPILLKVETDLKPIVREEEEQEKRITANYSMYSNYPSYSSYPNPNHPHY